MKTPSKTSKTNPKATYTADLVGQFFHSITKDTKRVQWQGVVIGEPQPGWYLVELFEWLTGAPNVRRLMRIEDMETWLFYDTSDMMIFSYDHGVAKRGGEYRKDGV